MHARAVRLLPSLALATLLACVANSGPWQWVESPSAGTQTDTGIEIAGLGLHFTTPTTLQVFSTCVETEHVRDAAGMVPVLRCTSATSPDITLLVSASNTAPFPDDAAIVPLRDEYQAAGWTVAALGHEGDYQGKSGLYARLQAEGRERMELRFFSKGVVYIAGVEYPIPNELPVEQDWQVILANLTVD
jgi:hypothetical protein